MKLNNIKYLLASGAMLSALAPAIAQETYSGYFVDGYEYRFRMNPAFGNETGQSTFISIPAVSNLNLGMRGNLHLTDLLYTRGGKTVLFTNPEVSSSTVMGNLSAQNKIGLDFNVTLLAGGFKAFGGYNTVSLNARGAANFMLPKDLFSLLKDGVSNKTYDITDIYANANAFAELSLGHSRNINSQWRVGGALKFLFGIANFEARLNNANLTLGTDNWMVTTNAEVHANMNGFAFKTNHDNPNDPYVDGADMDSFGLGGFGMALDLGAVYTLNQDWQFSAAVLDFGFISWSNDVVATTNGDRTFETDKYTFSLDDKADNSFDNEWDKVKNGLDQLYHLENKGDQGSRTTMPSATINLGARYTFPLYRPLTFGLVNTTHINGKFTWTDFRLSANVAPVKMFSASANLAVGTYGAAFGWMLNYHYTGFGLFLGMDHTLGKLAKQGVPLNSNASLNFGMNVLF